MKTILGINIKLMIKNRKMVFYMSDDEKMINPTKNKLWFIFSTIIKSTVVLLIIAVIMYLVAVWGGEEIYTKNSSNRYYTGGWLYHEDLNSIYGLIGIIIYIAINCFGFLLYNYITNKFKNYKMTIGRVMFILFSIFINILMLIIYSGLFGSYSFENTLLEFFNVIIINFGFITFPIMFLIIYIYRKKVTSKK